MDIETIILDDLGEKMSNNIDFEVIADVLCRVGWSRIDLPRYIDNHHAIDIRVWAETNCTGKTKQNGASWLFESEKDAILFKLRWS